MTATSDPARKPLLIIQLVLVFLLVAALALSAITEQGNPGSTIPTGAGAPSSTPVGPTDVAASPNPNHNFPTMETVAPFATDTTTASPTSPPTASQTTATATTPPEPILRTGTGDAIWYPQKWIGAAIVRITYDGKGPLGVWTQDGNGRREDMLVDTIGAYHGESLIDFQGQQRTLRIEVRTAESWHIELLPLSSARREGIPGVIRGSGDQVILLAGTAEPQQLRADAADAFGNFRIWAYAEPSSLVINVVAPYEGGAIFPPHTTAIAVRASGPWRLDIDTP